MLNASDLRIIHFAPIEPDVVVSEIWIGEERIIAELVWGFDGTKKLWLSEGKGVEVDPVDFAMILSRETAHLDQWAADLRLPGGAWDPANGYYTGQKQ